MMRHQFIDQLLGSADTQRRPAGGVGRQGRNRRMCPCANDQTRKTRQREAPEDGNTYVPTLISSESLAYFFASIIYNPVPKTTCSLSSQINAPLITAEPIVRVGLLELGPNVGSV